MREEYIQGPQSKPKSFVKAEIVPRAGKMINPMVV